MNRILKFSWLNILTFMALIVLGYVMYMGVRYTYQETPSLALWVMCILLALLSFFFVGAQMLKGTEENPPKFIKWERVFVVCSIIVFLAAMVPFFMFWNVFSNREEINDRFEDIAQSSMLFEQYKDYATERYKHYRDYADEPNSVTRANKLEIIDLMLNPKEVDSLQQQAQAWLDDAIASKPTVWNVFLVGNANQLEQAIHSWHEVLVNVSRPQLQGESFGVFDEDNGFLYDAVAPIKRLRECYNPDNFTIEPLGILVAVLLLLALSAPYFAQKRNTKSIEHFWGRKKKKTAGGGIEIGGPFGGPIGNMPSNSTSSSSNNRGSSSGMPYGEL